MDSDETVRQQLLFLLRGGNAHMTFDEAVADFPLESINKRPANVPYTPWHILEHMRIAQWDILEFIRNPDHVSPDFPEGYWPEGDAPPSPGDWDRSIEAFLSDLRALQELVADLKTDLPATIPHAEGATILHEALLVADHSAYHLGQLIMLRRCLGAWDDS